MEVSNNNEAARYVVKATVKIDGEEKTKFFSPLVRSKARAQEFVILKVAREGNELVNFIE